MMAFLMKNGMSVAECLIASYVKRQLCETKAIKMFFSQKLKIFYINY
jgi:hypothetical protein